MTATMHNRTKLETEKVYVSRDHEAGNDFHTAENNYHTEGAVYVRFYNRDDNWKMVDNTFSPDEAREIAAALIEAAAEFDAAVAEANKPKPVADQIDELALGTRFRIPDPWKMYSEDDYYVKVSGSQVVFVKSGEVESAKMGRKVGYDIHATSWNRNATIEVI